MRRPAEEPTPRPARRSSTDGRPPPHRGESTAAPGRDRERVVPHRRATDEGKRPSARGGGPQKRPPHRKAPSDAEARGSEKKARTRKRRTAAPHEVRAPAVRGAKGQRGEEVKRRRGEEAKGQRSKESKKSRCRPASPPGRRQYFFLQFVNLCVTLRDKAP